MKIGSGFVIVITLTLIGLGMVAVAAPDPARMAGYFPAAFRTTYVDCPGGRRPLMDDFSINWYGGMLVAADEPSLLDKLGPAASDRQTYRFSWLPSFHNPVFVRLDRKADGRLWLTATLLSGKGGYSAGSVEARINRQLSAEEEGRFRNALAEAAELRLAPMDCHLGADGAEWILEAKDAAGYRYVNRWSPDDGAVKQLGVTMLSFTGWKLHKVY